MSRGTRALPISAFAKKYQDQIIAQLHLAPPGFVPSDQSLDAVDQVIATIRDAKRLRQSAKGPNKTEVAFGLHLRSLYPSSRIYEQGVTLVLANGVRYTADFFFPGGNCRPAFYETKGFLRDDAGVKIKVAAEIHRWADFFLVTKRTKKQGGGWSIEIVLPLQQ